MIQKGVSLTESSAFFGSRILEVWFLPPQATPMPTFHVNQEMGMDLLPYAKLFSICGRQSKDKQGGLSQHKG